MNSGVILYMSASALALPRYKHLVQVVIGEMKGAGVRYVPRDSQVRFIRSPRAHRSAVGRCGVARRMGCRCLWDSDTDKVVQETFFNVTVRAPSAACDSRDP